MTPDAQRLVDAAKLMQQAELARDAAAMNTSHSTPGVEMTFTTHFGELSLLVETKTLGTRLLNIQEASKLRDFLCRFLGPSTENDHALAYINNDDTQMVVETAKLMRARPRAARATPASGRP